MAFDIRLERLEEPHVAPLTGFVRSLRQRGWRVPNVDTVDENRNASVSDIVAAIPDTQAFLDLLPHVRVVVFCGRRAQRAIPHIRVGPNVVVLSTFHPGAQAYNRSHQREHIHHTLKEAAAVIANPWPGRERKVTRLPPRPRGHLGGIAGRRRVEIWFQDEARIGQMNGRVRQWARRGTRPMQPADQRSRVFDIYDEIIDAACDA